MVVDVVGGRRRGALGLGGAPQQIRDRGRAGTAACLFSAIVVALLAALPILMTMAWWWWWWWLVAGWLQPVVAGSIQHSPPLPAMRDQLTQRMPMGCVIKVGQCCLLPPVISTAKGANRRRPVLCALGAVLRALRPALLAREGLQRGGAHHLVPALPLLRRHQLPVPPSVLFLGGRGVRHPRRRRRRLHGGSWASAVSLCVSLPPPALLGGGHACRGSAALVGFTAGDGAVNWSGREAEVRATPLHLLLVTLQPPPPPISPPPRLDDADVWCRGACVGGGCSSRRPSSSRW